MFFSNFLVKGRKNHNDAIFLGSDPLRRREIEFDKWWGYIDVIFFFEKFTFELFFGSTNLTFSAGFFFPIISAKISLSLSSLEEIRLWRFALV